MFLNVEDYNFLNEAKSRTDEIAAELKQSLKLARVREILFPQDNKSIDYYTEFWAKDNGFHPEQIGHDIRKGDYKTLTLFKQNYPNKLLLVEEIFPLTFSLLKSVPGLHFAAFFRMGPKSALTPHKHSRQHLIFHLLLHDLENGNSYIRCNNEEKCLSKKGDTALFDYSLLHSSENLCDSDRLNFIIDFNPQVV